MREKQKVNVMRLKLAITNCLKTKRNAQLSLFHYSASLRDFKAYLMNTYLFIQDLVNNTKVENKVKIQVY